MSNKHKISDLIVVSKTALKNIVEGHFSDKAVLSTILANSTPLKPILEDAYKYGNDVTSKQEVFKNNYINNLEIELP